MTRENIPDGLRLCRSAGWNQTSSEWEWFLGAEQGQLIAAVDENGTVIGTACRISYQDRFSWIGMVLVDPAHQRKGIGTELMSHLIHRPLHPRVIRLDATPAGREVYLGLGFRDEYKLARLAREAVTESTAFSTGTLPLSVKDWPDVKKMDSAAFGAERLYLLEQLAHQSPQLATVTYDGDHLAGYGFGRQGFQADYIGPIVASETSQAFDLLLTALHATNRKVIMDVPLIQSEFILKLESVGFRTQRILHRMVRGENDFPGLPQHQFSILGPEFG